MSSSTTECQRFFAFSKRVPKDVKRFCGICRQHGKLEETRGHVCEFKDCQCQKCNLVRSRRLVMSQQIRLRRAQDKRFQRTTEPEEADVVPILTQSGADVAAAADGTAFTKAQLLDAKNMCYFCQKCKNHGILVWKKQHKRQCPFTNCTCDFCELIETRRRLDQHIKRRKSEPQGGGHGADGGQQSEFDGDESPLPRKKSTVSLPAHIEALAGSSSTESAASSFSGHQRYSPPSGGIPIGIAAGRIAEEEPLDALAAQLSRFQQQSPSDDHQGQQAISSSPGLGQMGLDQQQQQQLLSQLLLFSVSSPHSQSAALLPTPFGIVDDSTASSLFNAAPTAFGHMGPLEQMLALAAGNSPQFQQQQANNNNQQQLINEALLGQLLAMGVGQQPLAALPKLDHSPASSEAQQREVLYQVIAQLLHEQHNDHHQQQAFQQQQQEKTLMDMLLTNGMGNDVLQQLAIQSAGSGVDATALAAFLMAQQQQQQNLLKAADLPLLMPSASADQQQQQSSPATTAAAGTAMRGHASAFSVVRPGFGGLP